MKFYTTRILILLIYPFIIYGCDFEESYKNDVKWMTEISGVHIPENSDTMKVDDNWEWGIIAKFQLNKSNISSFLKEYDFSPWEPWNIENRLIRLSVLEGERFNYDYNLELKKDYFFYSGCKPGNQWNLLVNEKTGEFWFEVLYPDHGGDIEECK